MIRALRRFRTWGLRPSWMTSRRGRMAATVAVMVLLSSAVVAQGRGFEVQRFGLSSGSAWLASTAVGRVTLVDGASEQVVGSLPVAEGEASLSVVQAGVSAFVLDRIKGVLTRVDGATYEIRQAPLATEDAAGLEVFASGSGLVVVDGSRQVASRLDPVSLRPRGAPVQVPVRPGPGQSVVDETGRLWALDATGGGLVGIDPDLRNERPVRSPVGDGGSRLVLVQGRPVMVDVTQGQVGRVDGSGQVGPWSCLYDAAAKRSEPSGTGLRLLGSASSERVFAAVSADGTLRVSQLGRAECGKTGNRARAQLLVGGTATLLREPVR